MGVFTKEDSGKETKVGESTIKASSHLSSNYIFRTGKNPGNSLYLPNYSFTKPRTARVQRTLQTGSEAFEDVLRANPNVSM